MNRKNFLRDYTERKMPMPGKGYWVAVLWTRGRTCRWVVKDLSQRMREEPAFFKNSAMLQKHVIGTAATPFCLKIQVFDQAEGVIYSISTEDFYRYGMEFQNPGRDMQFGCQLKWWTEERVNAEQGRMEIPVASQRMEH